MILAKISLENRNDPNRLLMLGCGRNPPESMVIMSAIIRFQSSATFSPLSRGINLSTVLCSKMEWDDHTWQFFALWDFSSWFGGSRSHATNDEISNQAQCHNPHYKDRQIRPHARKFISRRDGKTLTRLTSIEHSKLVLSSDPRLVFGFRESVEYSDWVRFVLWKEWQFLDGHFHDHHL